MGLRAHISLDLRLRAVGRERSEHTRSSSETVHRKIGNGSFDYKPTARYRRRPRDRGQSIARPGGGQGWGRATKLPSNITGNFRAGGRPEDPHALPHGWLLLFIPFVSDNAHEYRSEDFTALRPQSPLLVTLYG